MSTQFQVPRVLRFGNFEVDVSAGELRKNGIRVKLQQQPFQVLCLLAERPGELVTRDDLRNRLWPADTFVDFDHGLNAAVKRLRDALGDTAENPRFIETLAKRGYRFLVPVNGQQVAAAPEAPTIAVLPAPTSIPAAKRRTLMVAGLVSLLLVGSALIWFVAHRVSPKAHPTEQRLTANSPDIPVRWAALSPDGKYLAYWDRTSLFLRLISTGETHALNLPSECIVPEGRDTMVLPGGWFPDSTSLLVTHCGAADQPESVWNVSVLGGTPKEIMPDAEARAVSPDGTQITFVRAMGSGQSSQSLWVMDADGSHVRKLAGQDGDYFGQVAWAPDSRRIAFIRYISEPGYYHHAVLETYQVDNGVTNGILSEPLLESSLAWTHDNRLIYSVLEPSSASGDSNLWVISVDPQTGRARGAAERLTASPDRKLVVGAANSGNEFAYLRLTCHSHIYVSEVAGKGETNHAETRMKIDEGNNSPYGWMPDGDSLIFASDRDGVSHIYKQSVNQLTPDLLIGGDAPIGIPRISPDRSEIFYYVGPPHGKGSAPSRILSIAVNGGSPREVLRAQGIIDFQCARAPANVCIVAQTQTNLQTVHYSTFDPKTGVMVPALTIPGGNLFESFSPDGTTLAVATDRDGRVPIEIQFYNLRDATRSTLKVEGWGTDYGMDWNPDGKSLWVHARTPKGVSAIVNIDRQGHVTPLLEDSENQLGWAIPSPDGRRVAYSKQNISSNVWLMRDF